MTERPDRRQRNFGQKAALSQTGCWEKIALATFRSGRGSGGFW